MQRVVFTVEMRTPLHCRPAHRLQMKFMSVAAVDLGVPYVWNLREVSDRSQKHRRPHTLY